MRNLPAGPFRVIAADPPWRFESWSSKGTAKAADNHYQTMSLEEIAALPIAEVAAPDCLLLMWAVNPMLPQALATMQAWGFEYKTVGFVWAKTTRKSEPTWDPRFHMGLGYWTRANAEVCLLGTRGKPKRSSKAVRQLIVEPVREHSRKPEEFYRRTTALAEGPYLEMFARQKREGWMTWGNETEKYPARGSFGMPHNPM